MNHGDRGLIRRGREPADIPDGRDLLVFPKLEEALAVATHWNRSNFKTRPILSKTNECPVRSGACASRRVESLPAQEARIRARAAPEFEPGSNTTGSPTFSGPFCHLNRGTGGKQDLTNLPGARSQAYRRGHPARLRAPGARMARLRAAPQEKLPLHVLAVREAESV